MEASRPCALPDHRSNNEPVSLSHCTSALLLFPPYPLLGRMGYKNTQITRILSGEVGLVYVFVWKKKWHADDGFFFPLSHVI